MKSLELKKLYSNKTNQPLDKFRIRFLYKGQEIKDDHSLYMHTIEDGCKIQVSIASIL